MKQAIEILQRRKWLFIIPFAVVFVVPVIYSFIFMRSYEADSLVWLNSDVNIVSVLGDQGASQGNESPMQQEADTLQQLLQSRTFLTGVIAKTPLQSNMGTPAGREKTIAYMAKNLKTAVVGPNALRVSFFGRNPKEAVTIVSVTTNEFLAWVKRAVKQQSKQSSSFFSAESDTYRTQLDQARAELRAYQEKHPETQQLDIADKVLSAPRITASPAVQSEFQRLKSQVDYSQQLYDSSLSDLAKMRVLSGAQEERYVNGMRIVDAPITPTSFSKKRLLLSDALALIAAIIVGSTAVIVAELADRTFRSEQDVADELELEVLTEIRQAPQSVEQA
jgi:uncharacterized protein involved in exopolysaccharide biosynthesis